MRGAARFDFSGFSIALEGDLEGLGPLCGSLWGPFSAGDDGTALLRCRVEIDRTMPAEAPYDPKAMIARIEPASAAFRMGTGRISLDARGSAVAHLAPAGPTHRFYTLANLVTAALAWLLPRHDALVLHAACCLLDDRAFVLVGAENAGKSTFARLAGASGGRVLSDDLILVRATAAGGEALASPIRAMDAPGPGRWPLAAILFPEHARSAALVPVSRLAASAKLAANLPFVQEGFESYPRPLEVAGRLLAAVPCRILRFPPDPSFVPLLRAFDGTEP